MSSQNRMMKIYNNLTSRVLHSRCHGMMSKSTLLVSVTGRKSGMTITTPVNYVPSGRDILITSDLEKNWWRNLRANKSVVIYLKAKEIRCEANLIETGNELIINLEKYFNGLPSAAKYLKVTRNADGTFEKNSLEKASVGRVMVICRIPE